MLENDISYNLISEQSAIKLTTWIVRISVDKNIPSYVCMFEKATYHKLVALQILYKLVEKVDWEG